MFNVKIGHIFRPMRTCFITFIIITLFLPLFSINMDFSNSNASASVVALVNFVRVHKYHTRYYRRILNLYYQLRNAGYPGEKCLGVLAVVRAKTGDYTTYSVYNKHKPTGYFNFRGIVRYRLLRYSKRHHLNPQKLVTQLDYLDMRDGHNLKRKLKWENGTVKQVALLLYHKGLQQREPRHLMRYVLFVEEELEQW